MSPSKRKDKLVVTRGLLPLDKVQKRYQLLVSCVSHSWTYIVASLLPGHHTISARSRGDGLEQPLTDLLLLSASSCLGGGGESSADERWGSDFSTPISGACVSHHTLSDRLVVFHCPTISQNTWQCCSWRQLLRKLSWDHVNNIRWCEPLQYHPNRNDCYSNFSEIRSASASAM